jgi:hypothetical protein
MDEMATPTVPKHLPRKYISHPATKARPVRHMRDMSQGDRGSLSETVDAVQLTQKTLVAFGYSVRALDPARGAAELGGRSRLRLSAGKR